MPSAGGRAFGEDWVVADTNSEAALRGSYVAPRVMSSGARSNLLELNGARSNPRLGVELARLSALHEGLLLKIAADPREPRPAQRRPARVLATITRVLEEANCPMRAREIHAAAEQLSGEPLLWSSVKGTLAAYVEGSDPRFERVRRGYYRIRAHGVRLPA